MLKVKDMIATLVLCISLCSCSAVSGSIGAAASITPKVVPQMGKTNSVDMLGKHETNTTEGDTNTTSTEMNFTPSSSMIASFLAGGTLSMLTSLGFIYMIISERKRYEKRAEKLSKFNTIT